MDENAAPDRERFFAWYHDGMIRFLALFVVVLAPVSAVAAASGATATGTLRHYCMGAHDVDAGFCAGYVTAIADLMKEQQLYGVRTCNLEPVHSQQLMDLMRIEMQEKIMPREVSAAELTAGTLARYYPCR